MTEGTIQPASPHPEKPRSGVSRGAPDGCSGKSPLFCEDGELGYRRSLTDFTAPLTLDESYRLAHLPLVAPEHPGIIARREGKFYEMGRHPAVYSLVLPVEDGALRASPAFLALEAELKAAPFAGKIAWGILPERQDRLHATICGSLSLAGTPVVTAETREALRRMEPFTVELRGLFSGNVNRGRLYLPVYPQKRAGRNMLQEVQAAFGRAPGDLWLVGLYNLTGDLDADETAALAEIISRWWNKPLLRFTVSELQVMGASDDLVLDAHVETVLPLGA